MEEGTELGGVRRVRWRDSTHVGLRNDITVRGGRGRVVSRCRNGGEGRQPKYMYEQQGCDINSLFLLCRPV